LNHVSLAGVRGLPDERFAGNSDKQFDGNNFFGDQLFAITDQATALRALRTIIEQGEGNLRVDDSHYDVFSRLYSEPDSWEVYNVPDNPKTSDYNSTEENHIYMVEPLSRLSFSCPSAHTYLLTLALPCFRRSVLLFVADHPEGLADKQ
jgi:hypothetical protein